MTHTRPRRVSFVHQYPTSSSNSSHEHHGYHGPDPRHYEYPSRTRSTAPPERSYATYEQPEVYPVPQIPVYSTAPYLGPRPRPHPLAPAQPLHDLGFGPTPLFGWGSVAPQPHTYGVPAYFRHQKPDYRRFCYSVGKAEVPYASLPGGPLYGLPSHMAEQMVRRW